MCEVSRELPVRIQDKLFGWNFFDDRLPGRLLFASPLPLLMQSHSAIRKQFRRGTTNTGHQLAPTIYVLIAHIEATICLHLCQQCSSNDLAARVFGPNDVAFLMIVKRGLATDLAGSAS